MTTEAYSCKAGNMAIRIGDNVKKHAAPLVLLVIFTICTYWEVSTHQFLANWDDQIYVTDNPAVRGFSWPNLKKAFTTFYSGNYAPVQIVSYMLDYALWGMKPAGFLLANIFYHFLSTLLLYFLLIRLNIWKWGAALGAAIFLVHPVQMESVAWVSQRKNVLAMVFYLAAFHAYVAYRDSGAKNAGRWYGVSIIAFILALLSKYVAIVFPLMIILFDLTFPPARKRLTEHADKLPYFIAALTACFLAFITQTAAYDGGRTGYPPNAMVAVPLTMLTVLVGYLRLLFAPLPSSLSIMYFPQYRETLDGPVLVALFIAGCMIAFGLYLRRRARRAFFWYSLFFIGLLPVSQLIPLVTKMNDRYLYFPMLGIAGLTALGCATVRDKLKQGNCRGFPYPLAAIIITLSLVVVLSMLCHNRGRAWKDTITLFTDTVAKVPNDVMPWHGLAEGYMAAGNIEKAMEYYERSSRYGYMTEKVAYDLAKYYLDKEEFDKARTHIDAFLRLSVKPEERLLLLAEYNCAIGNFPDAERQLLSHLAVAPHSARALFMLGKVNFMVGNYGRARTLYSRVMDVGDDTPELFIALSCLESMSNRIDRSINYLERALEKGYTNWEFLEGHEYLSSVRRDKRFRDTIRKYGGDVY